MSESAVSAKRGLGLVWRETGAVRSARPSRGQAAPIWKRAQWRKRGRSLPIEGGEDGGIWWMRILNDRVCWEKSRQGSRIRPSVDMR